MNETKSKLFSVGKILGGLIFCLMISFAIYICSMFFIYGAWHCPKGDCRTPLWADIIIFILLANPLFIFGIGAYFARTAVYDLAESKIWRAVMISSFALLPIFAFIGFVAYVWLSKN